MRNEDSNFYLEPRQIAVVFLLLFRQVNLMLGEDFIKTLLDKMPKLAKRVRKKNKEIGNR